MLGNMNAMLTAVGSCMKLHRRCRAEGLHVMPVLLGVSLDRVNGLTEVQRAAQLALREVFVQKTFLAAERPGEGSTAGHQSMKTKHLMV